MGKAKSPNLQKRSARGARTLEADYYLSPEVYRRETKQIFQHRWLYVGRCEALPEAGSYLLHEIDAEQLIFVRDEDSRIHAHYNLCRHRGTRLCEDASGRFPLCIQCPYHSWTYDLKGRLIGTPNMQEDFDRDSFPLISCTVDTWEGCVFVNLSPQPPPLHQALSGVWNKFKPWRLSELRVVGELIYDVAANWKLLFQNFSECYHCPTLHPHLNQLSPYRSSSNDLEAGPILGGPMRLSGGVESMTVGGLRCAPALAEDQDPTLVFYYTFFPNLFLSLFPEYVMIHRVDRFSPSRTRIVCQWLFDPKTTATPNFDPQPAIEFWDLTNRQDWHICEQVQLGIASRAYQPGPYSDLESMLAAFDQEYLASI